MPSKIAASLRLAAVACLTLATLLFTSLAASQSIALTFDDGPDMADKTGLSAAERNAAILSQLAEAHIKSILFVTRTDSDKNRNELIRQWGEEGHRIGNHTATHPNFEQVSLADYEQEFRACDNAIRSMPGFARRFRFPYLKEGNTAEKRDGFRMFLDSSGYKPGPVSVDASDWYYSKRLVDRLKREPQADRLAYRDAYLRHLYDRAQYYDGLSRAVLGRSVAHVLLLHHNLINALFLRGDPEIGRQIAAIQAIDNHAHPVLAPPFDISDREFDALPVSSFVLLHGGWPFVREMGALLQKPTVYADISSQSLTMTPHTQAQWLREWLEIVPEKVLFGTDGYPYSDELGWLPWQTYQSFSLKGA